MVKRFGGAFVGILGVSILAGCGVHSITSSPRLPRPISPQSVYMVSSSDGWALTKHDVYRTQDGGRYWMNVTPVGYRGLGNGVAPVSARSEYAGAVFPTICTAVIRPPGGGVVWSTQDGGQVWHHTLVPGPPLALSMPNAQDGWLEVAGGSAAGSEAVSLYRTIDGGQALTRIAEAYGGPKGSEGNLPFFGAKLGLALAVTRPHLPNRC